MVNDPDVLLQQRRWHIFEHRETSGSSRIPEGYFPVVASRSPLPVVTGPVSLATSLTGINTQLNLAQMTA